MDTNREMRGLRANAWRRAGVVATAAVALVAATVVPASARPAARQACPALLRNFAAKQASQLPGAVYPGAAWTIAWPGHIRSGQVGIANAETGEATRPDSIYRLASMTKPVIAVAVLTLVEQGKLSLDDPIARFVPELGELKVGKLVDGAPVELTTLVRPITIRDVLTHTSGLEGDPSLFRASLAAYANRTSLAAQMPVFAKLPVGFQPGTKWNYSPVEGFDILARIVEVASGVPLDRYLKTRIFDPLGMADTGFELAPRQQARLVGLYMPENGKFTPVPSPFNRSGYFSGGAGLFSTAGDYLKFGTMLLQKGSVRGHRILRPESVNQIGAFQIKPGFPGLQEGLGWGLSVRVVDKDPALPSGSFGWSGAFGTHFWVDPKNRIVAILMINSAVGGGADAPAARKFEQQVAELFRSGCLR